MMKVNDEFMIVYASWMVDSVVDKLDEVLIFNISISIDLQNTWNWTTS